MVKVNLSKDSLRLWFEHPVTKLLVKALRDGQEKDNSQFIGGCSLNAEQYMIERNLYRLMGKQEITKKIIEFEGMQSLLKYLVEWDDS